MKRGIVVAGALAILTGCTLAQNAVKVPVQSNELSNLNGQKPLSLQQVPEDTVAVPDVMVPPHIAIPDPAITVAIIEQNVRNFLNGNLDSVVVESKPVEWAVENMNYESRTYLPGSSIWVATVTGYVEWPFRSSKDNSIAWGNRAICALDVEQGLVIACNITNLP